MKYKCFKLPEKPYPDCGWYCKAHGSRGDKEGKQDCASCINRVPEDEQAFDYEAGK